MVVTLSPRVLVVAIGVSALTALVAGLLPGFQACRDEMQPLLQDTTRGSTSLQTNRLSRWRRCPANRSCPVRSDRWNHQSVSRTLAEA